VLRPYLIGEKPKPNGEWDMYCPLHPDGKRSASLNIHSEEWYCFAGCGGGRVVDLIRAKSQWVSPSQAASNGVGTGAAGVVTATGKSTEVASEGKVAGWHSALMSNEAILEELLSERGLYTDTITKFEIGWHVDKRVYTIPIRGFDGELWNIRYYDLKPRDDRRKIWSIGGMRSTELYPVSQLGGDRIVICEGEWDTLVTIQNGYPAITRTAAARVWQSGWGASFEGKTVYICHDADDTGQIANRKVARALRHLADVRIVKLPYPIVEKHGQDLSDFWLEHDRTHFEQMLAEAIPFRKEEVSDEPEIITVLDTFDAQRVSEPVKVQVTIKGKKDPGYSVPSKARLSCTRDAGAKCNVCPLNPAGGEAVVEIAPSNPLILGLMESSQKQVQDMIRQEYGALQCNRLTIEIEEHQSVEVLFARPSIDHADGTQARDYKSIKITSSGRHDTLPNNTVVATGSLYPNPRDQRNEFLAWSVEQQETSVDRFQMTPEAIKLMERFKPKSAQRPLNKLGEINRALATHVTRITGRPEMHAVMDLTYHSALAFKFGGQVVNRGWIESLVVGDTRTGKSEAAQQLVRHYGAGEMVGGEAATLAGLVGGLQQIGGKDWAVTWGVIPINDRRLVVIDELSGLHPEEIAKMSDVRASGMAKLTKIQQEVTFARTRLLWLGNPRHGGMDQFTYGVDALRPLIGNPEDIARFDLCMAVSLGDVPSSKINQPARTERQLRYTSEACHTLLMWVWTRQADQIVFTTGAENAIYKYANEMGSRYVEEPPLVQAANIRIKIARVAVALAARTFSTDDAHEKVIVKQEHVKDAVDFMDRLYEMPSFGYAERSRERIRDIQEAVDNKDKIKKYLHERKGLAKFLRSVGKFRRQDLEEILNLSRDDANAITNTLWNARMVRKDGMDIRVEPMLHELLREVRL
jgi:hypothetical protein